MDAARQKFAGLYAVQMIYGDQERIMKLMEAIRAGVADLPRRPLLFMAVTAATAVFFLYKWGNRVKTTADPEHKTPPEAVCDQATDLSLLQKKEFPQHQVSLEEAEEKHQNAVESIAQLDDDKSALQDKIETLLKTVQEMINMVHECNKECESLTNEREQMQEAHNILQATKTEITGKLQLCEQLLMEYKQERESHSLLQCKYYELKGSLAKVKERHQKAEEAIAQLREERTGLTLEMKNQRETVQEIKNQLHESKQECGKLTNEREKEQESRSLLMVKYEQMKKNIMHNDSFLKVSLEEAEEKHQNAVKSITQLKAEKSALQDQVETLQKTVQEMVNLLHESNNACSKLTNEREQELETHNLFKFKYKELEETLAHKEEILKECQREQESHEHAHSLLQDKYDELKVSLTNVKENHRKAEETIALIKEEKSDLASEVENLKETVQELGNLLTNINKECDELKEKHATPFRSNKRKRR